MKRCNLLGPVLYFSQYSDHERSWEREWEKQTKLVKGRTDQNFPRMPLKIRYMDPLQISSRLTRWWVLSDVSELWTRSEFGVGESEASQRRFLSCLLSVSLLRILPTRFTYLIPHISWGPFLRCHCRCRFSKTFWYHITWRCYYNPHFNSLIQTWSKTNFGTFLFYSLFFFLFFGSSKHSKMSKENHSKSQLRLLQKATLDLTGLTHFLVSLVFAAHARRRAFGAVRV